MQRLMMMMSPVPTEDAAPAEAPPPSIWRALADLAISVIVVSALALIVGFIAG
jgi:sulfonate transport system substrate-binding protein